MPIPPTQPYPLQVRSGPWTFLQTLALAEGEPYEAGIIAPDGSVIEAVFFGGHDGVNKLQGSGCQVYNGDITKISAPAGLQALNQATRTLWICNGGTDWFPVSGGSGVPTIGTIDGGTWI